MHIAIKNCVSATNRRVMSLPQQLATVNAAFEEAKEEKKEAGGTAATKSTSPADKRSPSKSFPKKVHTEI